MGISEPTPGKSRLHSLLSFAPDTIAFPTVTSRGFINSQTTAIFCAFRKLLSVPSLKSRAPSIFASSGEMR
jgi:hypothetical protein